MKRTLMTTVAMIFAGHMAFAAIDPQQLADSYIADGYTYVEVKQGPTQTKIEAVKGSTVVEAVYLNETGALISQESQAADAEEAAKTGVEVSTTTTDFEDVSDENDDQATDEGDDHDAGDDDAGDDDQGDDNQGDDNQGDDDGGSDDDGGDDDGDSGGDSGGESGGTD